MAPPAETLERAYQLMTGGCSGSAKKMRGEGLNVAGMSGHGLRMAGMKGRGVPINLRNIQDINYT
jgi:hypothetical protein